MGPGNTVMLFGLGDLGGWVLEFLARQSGASTIITLDNREQWGVLKTHGAAAGAGHMGYNKTIEFEKCDLFDIDRTAEIISKYKPDLIYSSAALMSPQVPRYLPPEQHQMMEKIIGHMIPAHLTLIYNLMRAIKKSGIIAPVINNSMPDITNPMLWRNGLGPVIGAGNLDIVVADIKRHVSIKENVPITEITVYLVAEHSWSSQIFNLEKGAKSAPYFLKIMLGDKDITGKYDSDSTPLKCIIVGYKTTQSSWIIRPTVASCAVRIIEAMLNDTNELNHAPGPNGLIGGYPVRVGANGVEVVLPEGITMEEAIELNMNTQKLEGIEKIEDDGTLVLTDEACEIANEILGINWNEIKVADIEDMAKELLAKYEKLAGKYHTPTTYMR